MPEPDDIALFDSAMATESNAMNRIGGDMQVRGIKVADPAAVNVSSGYMISPSLTNSPTFAYTGTLSIGRSGIDLSSALAPPEISNWFFGIGCPIAITADQEWIITTSSGLGRWDLAINGGTTRRYGRRWSIERGGICPR